MNRRNFLSTVAAVAPHILRGAGSRPNVLLILADDLGWGDITINGANDIRTPNIDSIARQGLRFTQSYANAPECSPTRCGLLTGRYQQRVGGLECAIGVNNIGRYDEAAWLQQRGELGLPASEPTIGSYFKTMGYDTGCFGKWHLGYSEKFRPNQHGFDEYFGILGGGADYFTHEEQNEGSGHVHMYRNGERVNPKGYNTDLFAEAAVDWLRKREKNPFLLYLPFTAPHTPIQAAEDYDPKTGTAPHRQKQRPAFAKMVERLDLRIGDVLAALDRTGQSGNTIVLFMSDNGGDPNGRNLPFRGQKSQVWEGGIRSPLHVRWPDRIRPGQTTSQVALSMDLLPTLLGSIAGAPRALKPFDGHNLSGILTGGAQPHARTVFWRYKRGKVVRKAVRHGDWKYLSDPTAEELHNLAEDPREEKNELAARSEIATDLKARLAQWEKDVQAPRLRDFKPA